MVLVTMLVAGLSVGVHFGLGFKNVQIGVGAGVACMLLLMFLGLILEELRDIRKAMRQFQAK